MASTQQCPKGHFYDPSMYSSCPHCQDNTIHKSKSSMIPWFVAIIAVLFAVLSMVGSHGNNEELEEVSAELAETQKKLAEAEKTLADNEKAIDKVEEQMKDAIVKSHRYDELSKILGKGTNVYHSKIPVVVLKPGGATEKIPIFCSLKATVEYNVAYVGLSKDNENFQKYGNSSINAKWSGKWNNDWTELEVTSGNGNGVYFLVFSNDKNSDEFSVLVIVDQNLK